jgi:hypothetical protein
MVPPLFPGSYLGRFRILPPMQKNGPRRNGGQVALVLSRCESLVGGLTAGWPLALEQSLGGG